MHNRLRVLLSSHGASLFGAERVLLALAQGLAARGRDVTVELPHAGPAVDAAQSAGIQVRVTGRARLPRNVLELGRYLGSLPADVRRLRAAMRSGEYDVIWVNSVYNLPAALAARSSDAAVVWHLHERNFAAVAGWAAARSVRALCDAAIAPSRFVADSFVHAGVPESRLSVVPNALLNPVTPAPTRVRGREFVVGYVGQFEPRKRAPDVVEAVALLDDVHALFIGDGKARHELESAIARLRLEQRVRLAGFQQDVHPFIAECDCIVIPSRNEPFGLVALEAMAVGRPVIAADSGALPDVLGDAALYYPLADRVSLAGCIRRLRENAGLAADLRARGLARVARFSMERMIDDADAAARRALSSRGTRARTDGTAVHA